MAKGVRMIQWFFGLRYYQRHLIIAAAISAAAYAVVLFGRVVMPAPLVQTDAVLAGAIFYGVREVIQWRQKGYFDWPGLLWPVVPLTALTIILRAV